MLLPILEVTAEGSACLVKNLKFSYPLNDRALADAVALEYHNFNPEQPVIDSILYKLIKQGFDTAKMTCRTHIEVTYLGFEEGYKGGRVEKAIQESRLVVTQALQKNQPLLPNTVFLPLDFVT